MIPKLTGLAILDNDGRDRAGSDAGGLEIVYWRRYEAENYFITPEVLRAFVAEHYGNMELFNAFRDETNEVLDQLIQERVFAGSVENFETWRRAPADAARLLWEAKTERLKLSDFAEEFFRRLAAKLGHAMLLKKGDLHQLVAFCDPAKIPQEVGEKLNRLKVLFDRSRPNEEA